MKKPLTATQINLMYMNGKQLRSPKDYPTFYNTIVKSKEWKAWIKFCKETHMFDIIESTKNGYLSEAYWNNFIGFIKNN